jgi:glycosyltransferase involved in cell wall biosynthesis
VVPAAKAGVLRQGSISGVDVKRFRPDPGLRMNLRRRYGIADSAFVILYMARLTRDKGALVMAEAFGRYGAEDPDAELIVVGPDEEALRPRMRVACIQCLQQVHFVDTVHAAEEYMAGADLFCLPSFREGFGTSLINAAACGIPAIASRIYGSSDAIVDGVTGLLFEPGEVGELVALIRRLRRDVLLRRSMGEAARTRAVRDFDQDLLSAALMEFYGARLTPRSPSGLAGGDPLGR